MTIETPQKHEENDNVSKDALRKRSLVSRFGTSPTTKSTYASAHHINCHMPNIATIKH